MKIGLVAEGHGDIAVLRNILKGWLDLDGKDVLPIRPELAEDETDRARARTAGFSAPSERSFSNWGLVLKECGERARIADFLQVQLAGERLVVIHLDTAECHCPATTSSDPTGPLRTTPWSCASVSPLGSRPSLGRSSRGGPATPWRWRRRTRGCSRCLRMERLAASSTRRAAFSGGLSTRKRGCAHAVRASSTPS